MVGKVASISRLVLALRNFGREFAEVGGLISYGVDDRTQSHQLGLYIGASSRARALPSPELRA
jgi:hypothetical protein